MGNILERCLECIRAQSLPIYCLTLKRKKNEIVRKSYLPKLVSGITDMQMMLKNAGLPLVTQEM